jgi:carbamate kinase
VAELSMNQAKQKLAILAVGGNALILDEKHRTVQDQYAVCESTCAHIAGLVSRIQARHHTGMDRKSGSS